jgi:hypothetical protein
MQCSHIRRTIEDTINISTEQCLFAPEQEWSHCFKKFENHIYRFRKIYEKIQILTTMYPTYAHINVKYFVFWATQKWQTCRCEYTYFQISFLSDIILCMLVDYIVNMSRFIFGCDTIQRIFYCDFACLLITSLICPDLFLEFLKLINVIFEKKTH